MQSVKNATTKISNKIQNICLGSMHCEVEQNLNFKNISKSFFIITMIFVPKWAVVRWLNVGFEKNPKHIRFMIKMSIFGLSKNKILI